MQSIRSVLCVLLAVHWAVALPKWMHDEDNQRIVGGQTAEPNQFPYQVSLRVSESTLHFCGGSIIREHWILTAAHCLMEREPEEIFIVVGAHLITEQSGAYDVAEIIVHEHYNDDNIENDIGLARTAIDIVFGATVQPISLGDGTYVEAGLIGRASGWGRLYYPAGPAPAELQFVDVVTLSMEDCRSRHVDDYQEFISDSVLCVYSGETGRGLCGGDSGGPLVHQGVLIGAVSWGVPCATGKPDGFTRISVFLPWITAHVNRNYNVSTKIHLGTKK